MLKVIFKLIFYFSLFFLIVSLWTLTFGQQVPFEFRDTKIASNFYFYLFTGMPVTILLTLFGTIKKQHDSIRKVLTVLLTVTATVLCFLYLFGNMFTLGFGAWSTFNIAYENRQHPERQVREQKYDVGALGYGSDRVVEVEPILGLFWKVSPIDTTTIDKTEWKRIDKEDDVKFP